MSSALKNSRMQNMALFFSLDNKSTNLSAKVLTPERRKMSSKIVPSLSFILH